MIINRRLQSILPQILKFLKSLRIFGELACDKMVYITALNVL